MAEAPCRHRSEWWRPPTGGEVDEAERNGTYVSGALVCNACGDWVPLPGERRPLVMPADEFALVKRGLEVLDGLGRAWAHKVIVLGDPGAEGWPAPDAREALVSLGWTPPAGEAS